MSGFDRRSFLKASVATAAASRWLLRRQCRFICAGTQGQCRSVMGLVVPKMAEVRVGLIASVSEVWGSFTISTT